MPFLNIAFLRNLLNFRQDYDAIARVIEDTIQGQYAASRNTCLAPMQACLQRGQLRIQDFCRHIQARLISAADIQSFDPQLRSFVNLNTPDELAGTLEAQK